MTTSQDYTSMPWAPCSDTTSIDTKSPSSGVATSPTNNEALLQQLLTSHAIQCDQQRRIAEVHKEMDRRIADMQRKYDQRVGDLVMELSMCRKREDAQRIVFEQTYKKGQELAKKARELHEKEARLEEKEEQLLVKRKEVDDRAAGLEDTADATKNKNSDSTCVPLDTAKLPLFVCVWKCPGTADTFRVKYHSKFDKYYFPVLTAGLIDTKHIQLLRRHDYYKGWYDAKRFADSEKAHEAARISTEQATSLIDWEHSDSEYDAGANAGVLFTWAVLSQRHSPEKCVCLDDRHWYLDTLQQTMDEEDDDFWAGFHDGRKYADTKFWDSWSKINWDAQ
ncbi:hypothetical protein EK21DRAFT_110345 [Setomelanomma holmii]|uniref:Uncharacterized protein n=1 Tax=Setomelanomma holmii TaxID=210430 RepID=A0A9P4HFM9_9PLEO|nr:hypothetical protein EK21DRAFT_110345 [Setomelanomma holmii]